MMCITDVYGCAKSMCKYAVYTCFVICILFSDYLCPVPSPSISILIDSYTNEVIFNLYSLKFVDLSLDKQSSYNIHRIL